MICISVLSVLLGQTLQQIFLEGEPVTFNMKGQVSYTPDIGGATAQGYQLEVGFGRFSWLGISFSGNVQDVLILERSNTYTRVGLNTGHKISVADYFRSGSGGLIQDTITNFDQSPTAYTTSTNWVINMIRTIETTNSEDWNGQTNRYSMVNVCFFSSDVGFDSSNYLGKYLKCYDFEIDNLVSTFRGSQLGSISVQGNAMTYYGYAYGMPNRAYFSFYQAAPLTTFNQIPAFALDIGKNEFSKQDFVVYSPTVNQTGDYQGSSVQTMTMDRTQDGYDDYTIAASFQNIGSTTAATLSQSVIRFSFNRLMNTYDLFDKQLSTSVLFCLYVFNQGSKDISFSEKVCDNGLLTVLHNELLAGLLVGLSVIVLQ